MRTVAPREIAPGVRVVVVGAGPLSANVYLVGSHSSWVLIDAGWPGCAPAIGRAGEAAFGPGTRPDAILLTHLHPDHFGSVRDLVAAWGTPVFVHPRELPRAAGYVPEYANPLDRRVILPLLGLLPRGLRERVLRGGNLADVVRALDPAAPPPGLPDWRCVPAPGHTPGSIAFFRAGDRLLISGDAVLTVDLTALRGLLGRWSMPAAPLPFTDWDRTGTEATIAALARLEPRGLAPGHGRPRIGPAVAPGLQALADRLAAGRGSTARAS
jgi:glyoxylase-like metal-dependent hydrolase (beta-lactamase superfamily II)